MTMTNASSSARGRRVKFTPQAIEKIKELVAEGLSRDEIANRLGLTVGSSPSHMLKVRIISPNGSNDKKATALGSLERAHARPRGNDERTTEPRHVSPRRREACRACHLGFCSTSSGSKCASHHQRRGVVFGIYLFTLQEIRRICKK